MAPIRRYLRITKFSVLEVRIYLHKPSDASWLLSSRDNVLERIIHAVRPKVLPKLREENENAKKKSSAGRKKRITKDVAVQEDFEVSIFLKENSTRHSLMTKQKKFRDKQPRIRSTGSKLTGWLERNDVANPIRIEEDEEVPGVLREEGEDEVVELKDIPEATTMKKAGEKRKMNEEDADALFVSSSDEEFFATQRAKRMKSSKKRNRDTVTEEPPVEPAEEPDDKKKLNMDTSYDGFSIYGRILCLIVTRKGKKDTAAPVGGSQMMENWVSTQAAQEAGILGDDEG
ncbi:Hypothetical predicted protein [Lecanosticta acicola]|uniref:Uncharacterized protein n=1 Tax=Lecanosticta acicola TaxID=111012 RepID=A0AAI8YUT7_9PEZI|nr:Hypothetical predicted protein [Lecanosticta acicola]